ncbi:hypothetical protein CDAR_254211 [Caerostris darwini]|uniref:Uncharacterized protein n=1 Tax=Caerostris darwini TaxID=1538125 RepID=A0AAV4TY33_9ARAC|nr:hypothetical protein CDAR_254211 [Caerostris darwini]
MPLPNNIIMDPFLVSSKRTIAAFSRRVRRSFYASSELRRHEVKLDESSNNFSQVAAYPCFASMYLLGYSSKQSHLKKYKSRAENAASQQYNNGPFPGLV